MNKSREIEYVKLQGWDLFKHYSVLLILLIFPGVELFIRVKGETPKNPFSLTFYIVLGLVGLVIIILKRQELKFHWFDISRDPLQFKASIEATAIEFNWQIQKLNNREAIALLDNLWKSSVPHLITVKRTDYKIGVNSRINPWLISSIDFFRINKENRESLIRNYKRSNKTKNLVESVRNEMIEKELEIENEPEWNLKNTIKRIIAYLISLIFIAIAILTIDEGENHPIIFVLLIVSIGYIALDIYALLKKRKKPTHNMR